VKVLVEGVREGPLNNVNRTFKWRRRVPILTYIYPKQMLQKSQRTKAHADDSQLFFRVSEVNRVELFLKWWKSLKIFYVAIPKRKN
jgi:hypothetical protein